MVITTILNLTVRLRINNSVESECTTYTHGSTEEYSITMSSTYSEAINLANLIRTLYGEVK